MGTKKKRMFCEEEVAMVLAEKQTPNHLLHLVLTLLTAGLWVFVWAILIVTSGPYRCPHCGAKTLRYVPRKYRDELDTRRMLKA